MKTRKPLPLVHGDLIGICAPSGIVAEDEIRAAISLIESKGYRTRLGKHVFEPFRFFSSTDRNRYSDLQEMIDDPAVRAILCARGGFGAGKIVNRLSLELFKNDPKWVIGFSDITSIHFRLMKEGFQSIHGQVARQLTKPGMESSTNSLFNTLSTGASIIQWQTMSDFEGVINGTIFGGNLSMIVTNIGTPQDFNGDGKILFIEDVGENIYRVDRMMNHLECANKLKGLAGVLLGDFTEITDTSPSYGVDVYTIIKEYLRRYDFPVIEGFPTGHGTRNFPVIHNSTATLTTARSSVTLKMN